MVVSVCVCACVYVCFTPMCTGGLQPDIPPNEHASHWEMPFQSPYLRGFLLLSLPFQPN